jgi:predicted nucleic acid-binding protein
VIDSIVIDASVALKWFFEDEEDVAAARAILSRWSRAEVDFIVPPHWTVEVLNGFRSAIIKKRIDRERALDLAKDFLDLGIGSADLSGLWADVFRTAVDLGRTTYDAAYVVLAEHHAVEFITGDRRLFHATVSVKPFVKYLGGLDSPSALTGR